MVCRTGILLAVAGVVLACPVSAVELQPTHGKSIALGNVSGIAYYTVEADGYRVVAVVSPAVV